MRPPDLNLCKGNYTATFIWQQQSNVKEVERLYAREVGEIFHFNLQPVKHSHAHEIYEAMKRESMNGRNR